MDNLEQQCENALFELCDARERYPMRCADELQNYIKLNNDINTMKVQSMAALVFSNQNTTDRKNVLLAISCINENVNFEQQTQKLQSIINKYKNLSAVMKQIRREKVCEFNNLLDK